MRRHWQRVESRLSQLLIVVVVLGLVRTGAAAPLGTVAALGDSMTHEYANWMPVLGPAMGITDYTPQTLNWVEHLTRSGVDFGPQDFPEVARRRYNVAIGGAISSMGQFEADLLATIDHQREVDLIFVGLGANNFLDANGRMFDLSQGLYARCYQLAQQGSRRPLDDPIVRGAIDQTVADIANSLVLLRQDYPTARFVLATVPDLGVTPQYQQRYPAVAARQQVHEVLDQLNDDLTRLASQYGAPLVDLAALADLVSESSLAIAGYSLPLVSPPADTGEGLVGPALFLSDGFHPGTVPQGIIANAFLQSVTDAYDIDTAAYRISDQELVARAGLARPAGETYINARRFVRLTPEPRTVQFVVVFGGIWLLTAVAQRRRRATRARLRASAPS